METYRDGRAIYLCIYKTEKTWHKLKDVFDFEEKKKKEIVTMSCAEIDRDMLRTHLTATIEELLFSVSFLLLLPPKTRTQLSAKKASVLVYTRKVRLDKKITKTSNTNMHYADIK